MMGALHAGHLSLESAARAGTDRVFVTLFVNPRQFDSPEDLAKYPHTEESDAEKPAPFGIDVLYVPNPDEITPRPRTLPGAETPKSRSHQVNVQMARAQQGHPEGDTGLPDLSILWRGRQVGGGLSIAPQQCGAGMSFHALNLTDPGGPQSQFVRRRRGATLPCDCLDELVHRQSARISRGTACRQYMVGTRNLVAKGYGGFLAEKK